MTSITNKTFNEIQLGDQFQFSEVVTAESIRQFSDATGDRNPMHTDPQFAHKMRLKQPVAHGLWMASLFSRALGMGLPGPGTLYVSQTLTFLKPAFMKDEILVTVKAVEKHFYNRQVRLECNITGPNKKPLLIGEAWVIAPMERMEILL
jgi:acyl dehydratase